MLYLNAKCESLDFSRDLTKVFESGLLSKND